MTSPIIPMTMFDLMSIDDKSPVCGSCLCSIWSCSCCVSGLVFNEVGVLDNPYLEDDVPVNGCVLSLACELGLESCRCYDQRFDTPLVIDRDTGLFVNEETVHNNTPDCSQDLE